MGSDDEKNCWTKIIRARCLPSELCHAALPWGILSILHLASTQASQSRNGAPLAYSCQMVSINGFQGIRNEKKHKTNHWKLARPSKWFPLWSFHCFTLRVPPGSRAPTSAPGKDCAVKCENLLKACSISYVVAFWLTKTTSYKGFLTISAQTQVKFMITVFFRCSSSELCPTLRLILLFYGWINSCFRKEKLGYKSKILWGGFGVGLNCWMKIW